MRASSRGRGTGLWNLTVRTGDVKVVVDMQDSFHERLHESQRSRPSGCCESTEEWRRWIDVVFLQGQSQVPIWVVVECWAAR
jgi:hypothetical protein